MPKSRSQPAPIPPPRRSLSRAARRAQPGTRMPCKRRLLRGRQPGREWRARGRAGRSQPRPPPRLSRTACAASSTRARRAPTGCQFTFTCDGSLARQPDADGWRRAWKVAEDALSGSVYAPVGWATHYHADYVLPTWASSMAKNAIVGAHIFYRWAGGWGQAAAFSDGYAGREPNAAALRTAALAAPHVTPSASKASSPRRSRIFLAPSR